MTSLASLKKKSRPLTELPNWSIWGEYVQIPQTPGMTAMIIPLTPLFAGKPFTDENSPDASYMPHVIITDNEAVTVSALSTRSSVIGFRPPFAYVAATTDMDSVVTPSEQYEK